MNAVLYPRTLGEHGPTRSLAEYRHKLRGERIMLLLAQLEAETAGEDEIAAGCLRRIADIDVQLRAIDEAGR